jgi:nicotinamidase-related amidase
VRDAADLDYRLVVVEDCCADPDPEVHNFLTWRLFPRQAEVVAAIDVNQALTL